MNKISDKLPEFDDFYLVRSEYSENVRSDDGGDYKITYVTYQVREFLSDTYPIESGYWIKGFAFDEGESRWNPTHWDEVPRLPNDAPKIIAPISSCRTPAPSPVAPLVARRSAGRLRSSFRLRTR